MIANILQNTWSIFLGMSFLMLGNGLQGTLTSWRATYEGFPASTTGWIMTGYYLGFLAGSLITPGLVKRVGHIRVFAALASLASTAVLIQILFISPYTWLSMRVLTGFCFAGTFVIVESWLNARSDNVTRGRVLSLYMLISFAGMSGGQWLLKIFDPADYMLFVLSSILLSLALVPVLISRIQAPEIELHQKITIPELFSIVPSGTIAVFISSIAHGAMFGMGAVYAVKAGMTIDETVIFMSSFILFGALAQWPVGWLSDRMDRRLIIIGVSVIATGICVYLSLYDSSRNIFYLIYAFLGAMSLPIYSIGVAYINDRLDPAQMVGASSTIVLLLGIGALLGPISIGYVLDHMDLHGYFMHLGLMHFLIATSILYFVLIHSRVKPDEMTHYHVVPPRATMIAMEAVAHEAEESQPHDDSDH